MRVSEPVCRIESLETRRMLTITTTFEDGIITVIGTAQPDTIIIRTEGADQIGVFAQETTLPTQWQFFPRDQVQGARISGGMGRDVIDCGGFDLPVTVFAGQGNDLVIGSMAGDEIHGGSGNDTVNALAGNDTVYGGTEADSISLGSGDDVAYGLGGDDVIAGRHGSDLIHGDDDEDWLYGGGVQSFYQPAIADTDAGADTLYGGIGNDHLLAGYGPGLLDGGDGADYLSSRGIGDTLLGGTGEDSLVGNLGAELFTDDLTGGEGADVAYAGAEDLVRPDVESVYIGENGFPSVKIELVGNRLEISSDLSYQPANDDITFSADADTLHFQMGEIQYSRPVAGITGASFWLGGSDDVLDCSGFALPITVFAGQGNDSVIGSSANDEIHGGAGLDTILGMDGDDTLFGGMDDDSLYGEAGNDAVFGRAGADLLDGGDGEDAYKADEGDTLVDVEIPLLG